jgi:hypothetical protein
MRYAEYVDSLYTAVCYMFYKLLNGMQLILILTNLM